MGLTDKKRRFVAALQSGVTGAKGAIHADYSEKGAAQGASHLMKDKAVAAALAQVPEVNKPAASKKARGSRFPPAPVGWTVGTEPPAAAPATQPTPPALPAEKFANPRDYLIFVMNDTAAEWKERLEAAKALLPFEHSRLAPKRKKEPQKDAAAKARS